MKPVASITIAATDTVFDALFKDGTHLASVQNIVAEAAYEALDGKLIQSIKEVGQSLFPPEFLARHIHVGDDWWPNHTRYIDASIDAFDQNYYDRLRALLDGEFAPWRIQVVVFGDPMNGQTMVGAIAICADEILIDRALYAVLGWRRIDLRCNESPKWRK